MRCRGFSLIELLTTIAIIAVLAAILFPVFVSVKKMAFQVTASQSERQIGQATLMYIAENDETFPLAMYWTAEGLQTWYGLHRADGSIDERAGLLRPHLGRTKLQDSTHRAKSYMGDQSGFGYNWGYLGSDFNVTGNFWGWPNCQNAATLSSLENVSRTITFGTSSYFSAPWLQSGDGAVYDLGFIDPPRYWNGNPNVDFRHQGERMVDVFKRQVTFTGNAVFAHADGHASTRKMNQVKDDMFERGEPRYWDWED